MTILAGDALTVLRTLPDESVQCCVTSPPYWGLRDYGTATWVGGGPGCAHSVGGQVQDTKWAGAITTGQRPGVDSSHCRACGATRIDSQLGLEATPEEYVTKMVGVFREVRRVLRSDGTLWLNMGDSYTSGGRDSRDPGKSQMNGGGRVAGLTTKGTRADTPDGLKPKDLVGIPWMLAFALRADGWYLRSDIIWSKPNPMPESVTDRPTKAHEYLFLLSKSAKYYYDADAIREPHAVELHAPGNKQVGGDSKTLIPGRRSASGHLDEPERVWGAAAGRNRRTVWTIATQPYAEAHFATFPEALVEPCILAGTSAKGCCPECGAPWERVTEREGMTSREWQVVRGAGSKGADPQMGRQGKSIAGGRPPDPAYHTTGWRPTCPHAHDARYGGAPVACTVLDPFAGSGTTLAVAKRLDREGIGIELNPDYIRLAEKRIRHVTHEPNLFEVTA